MGTIPTDSLFIKKELNKLNCIELFAGAGGLSLGLKSVGAKLVFANELSPMASQTFAHNFFNETLESNENPSHTLWLYSSHPKSNINLRLKENLKEFKPLNNKVFCDINSETDLNNKLLVGSIIELNKLLEAQPDLIKKLPEIDLVSGGPPCQSFSMAGLRELSNDRNTLPWEFVKFVSKVKPRFALLENVSGILRPFDTQGGKFYAWYEIAKAFALSGYIPLCLHINAKYAGVAQNRPRFILIAIREDLMPQILKNLRQSEHFILKPSIEFHALANNKSNLEYGHLKVLDIEDNPNVFINSFLYPLASHLTNIVPVKDAIDDLAQTDPSDQSEFVRNLNETFAWCVAPCGNIENHNIIISSNTVQARIRLYQIISHMDKSIRKEISRYLKDEINSLNPHTIQQLMENEFLLTDLSKRKLTSESELFNLLNAIKSKKQSQKALIPSEPSPTALCVPVDNTHYKDTRTLSVREMARIQSFPDNFKFLSKIDTGGMSRRYEIPQYTQVGNAVPPLLANALGRCIKELVRLSKPKKELKAMRTYDEVLDDL